MAEAVYRVRIDDDWELEDLYDFGYRYTQAHNFIFWFDAPDPAAQADRLGRKFKEYSLERGFSYAHAYDLLRKITPPLRIASMRIESPGWIDLFADLQTAYKVAQAVTFYTTTAYGTVTGYKKELAYWLSLDLKAERDLSKIGVIKRKRLMETMTMIEDIAPRLGFDNISLLAN